MKVSESIERLKSFDPNLRVAVDDWSECCTSPSFKVIEKMKVTEIRGEPVLIIGACND